LNADFRSLVTALRAGSPVVLDVPPHTRYFLLRRYLEMSVHNGQLGVVGMSLLLFGVAYEAPLLPRLGVLAAMTLLLAWRVHLANRLLRNMDEGNPRSNWLHDLLLLIGSSAWSIAPFVLVDVISEPNLFGIAYAALIVVAVMSVSYHSALPASAVLVAATFAPLVVFMEMQNTVMFTALTVVTMICVGALMSRLFTGHRTLLKSLAADDDNARLLNELQSYRHALEIENASLGLSLRDASQAASRDALTGLHNRRYLASLAEPLSDLVNTQREEITVCMIDVDHFKRINDVYGHHAGDEVLRGVAALLSARVRDGDCLARFGGEEFVVVLRRCDTNKACAVAESLRLHVSATTIDTETAAIGLTVSVGLAQWSPNEDFKGALQRADRALYAAKNAGRNRVEVDVADGLRLASRVPGSAVPEKLH
jgi:diguanylate cyclase (GGDEF)-like protein